MPLPPWLRQQAAPARAYSTCLTRQAALLPRCCRPRRRAATGLPQDRHRCRSQTTTQEAVMGNPVPVQHPAVVLRSQYRNMRSLVAVLLVAAGGAHDVGRGDPVPSTVMAPSTARTSATNGPPGGARATRSRSRTQPIRPQEADSHESSGRTRAISQSGKPLLPDSDGLVPEPGGAAPPAGWPEREQQVATAISPADGPRPPRPTRARSPRSIAKHTETGPQARAQSLAGQARLHDPPAAG